MQSVTLPRPLRDQILDHARSAPRQEVCGLVSSRDGLPVRCTAVANVAARPDRFFTMDPQQQIAAFRDMRDRGETLFAVYHSHPHGPAGPSETDLREAGYPEALQLIVSPDASGALQLRCYRFIDGVARELRLEAV